MEGTISGEHGVGLVKRDYLEHELGETTVDAMRRVSPRHAPFYSSAVCLPVPSLDSVWTLTDINRVNR